MRETVYLGITEGFWPNVYIGRTWSADEPPKFGISIKSEELPSTLRPFARMSERDDGVNLVNIRSQHQPQVICDKQSLLMTTWQCAQAANLALDEFFTHAPLKLAVETVEFEATRSGTRFNRGDTVRTLALRAIFIESTHLIRRYDELCAQYFTGA